LVRPLSALIAVPAVALATIGGSTALGSGQGQAQHGRIHGYRRAVQYSSASLVKAMLHVAYFSRIRELLPERHRAYAISLLRRIVSYERWGIPRARPPGWRVYFKGGWFKDDDGWRVHQAALLELGGRHIAIAVLTRGNPDLGYGAATIAGVTAQLLRGYR
jgi:hypothetical protein